MLPASTVPVWMPMPGRRAGLAAAPPRPLPAQAPAYVQRGAHRVGGVLRGGNGRAEDGLDLVADELEHQPVVETDGLAHLGEVLVEILHHVAGRGGFHPRGEVADVAAEAS